MQEQKHIEVYHYFIKEIINSRNIILYCIYTSSQHADIFTKALLQNKFMQYCTILGLTNFFDTI